MPDLPSLLRISAAEERLSERKGQNLAAPQDHPNSKFFNPGLMSTSTRIGCCPKVLWACYECYRVGSSATEGKIKTAPSLFTRLVTDL